MISNNKRGFFCIGRVDAISQNSVLFLTDLRVQNKTDGEILACLSYSRVSKGSIWVSVLFHTSGPGICLSYSMV